MSDEIRECPTDIVEAEKAEAVQARERFESMISNSHNPWGHSTVGVEAKRAAMTMLSTKTGMYARIPLVCKAEDCPYKETCQLLAYNLAPLGEPCPMEVAQIELRYVGYDDDFKLDEASFTDRCLVSEIINCDVMIERLKALLAKEGVPVIDVISGITEQGEEYTHPEVSKYLEAYDRVTKKRNEYYQLMMATRKDNKKDTGDEESISKLLASLQTGQGFIIEEAPSNIVEIDHSQDNQ
jgi:hypothetical protein